MTTDPTNFDPADFTEPEPGNGARAETSNPFDPEQLRLSQDFEASVGVQKALITVPVRKPDRQWFFRVRPGEEWRLPTAVLELKEERETFLVDPRLVPNIPGEVKRVMIYTAINRQGVVFLWPVRLPDGETRRKDNWSASAHEAAAMAERRWTRMTANMSLGAYEVFQATGSIPDPEWPSKTLAELLELAFKDRFIRDVKHDVIQQLLGAV